LSRFVNSHPRIRNETASVAASRKEEERMKIEGECLCGKVRYSAETEPVFVGVCHCKNCQKGTGTAFASVVGLPKPSLDVQGDPQDVQRSRRQRQNIVPALLSECGSSVMDETEAIPNVVFIMTGTLDDASWVKPTMEIFLDSAQPW
jgi:hypothetical protein